MKIEYAIVIKGKTRLEQLIERFNTRQQAEFYIERSGGDFKDYEAEHDQFEASLNTVLKNLSTTIKFKLLERKYVPSYIFSDSNVVLTIGQDGLVANTAKYSRSVPLIAVNPDHSRYDGVLLPFSPEDFLHSLDAVRSGKYNSRQLNFAEARLKDGQRLLAFNDLFIGVSSHVSARYKIRFRELEEEHSSSGIIVSTEAGTTGWMSSIFNMAYMITNTIEHRSNIKRPKLNKGQLLFAVREPFSSVRTQIAVSFGTLNADNHLEIESRMPNGGVIFSDGIESDFLHFNSGSIATIGPARETANLVLPSHS